jgi:hypothetical protein
VLNSEATPSPGSGPQYPSTWYLDTYRKSFFERDHNEIVWFDRLCFFLQVIASLVLQLLCTEWICRAPLTKCILLGLGCADCRNTYLDVIHIAIV